MATDLRGLLLDNGIKPKSLAPGHSEKLVCPECNDREKSLSVTIDADGDGATWQCHRGKCGWTGGERIHRDDGQRRPARTGPAPQKPKAHTPAQTANKPEWLYQFFAERRIGARTVDSFGIYAAKAWFPQTESEREAIVFPYTSGGEVVNRKYRDADKNFAQEKGALHTLYNVDRLGPQPDEVIFVEGEGDVLALAECGIPNVVSLKDGAGKQATFNPDDKRFTALTTHADLLERPKRIILAGDADAPGLALREELARRLKRERCWVVTWPAGLKDAGEVLMKHGPDAVTAAIENAERYPIGGLYELGHDTLLALRYAPPPPLMTTGTEALDHLPLRFPGEGGRLIVITGIPNMGKSSWTTFTMVHLMRRHGRKFAAFSPEMEPWQEYASLCAQILVGLPFRPTREHPAGMSDGQIIAAQDWLRPRLHLISGNPMHDTITLDWILERAAVSVQRDGTSDLLIDPWNRVESDRGKMTETEFIGYSLNRLSGFASERSVNVWVVVHPTKMHPAKPGARVEPPGLYDINGSANWANKADIGITVHMPGGDHPDRTEILVAKTRFRRWGRRMTSAMLEFHQPTGIYHDVGKPVPTPHELGWGAA